MGTFRKPVGPLPASVYWRRRIVLLGIPLFVIALVAYACTGTSGSPQNTAAPGGGSSASSSPTGVITPGASQTASGPSGHSYPTAPASSNSAGAGTGGTSSASSGSTAGAGTTHQAASGAAAGCALTLTIALDQTSSSGTVRYAAGTYPTFKITATDSGSANCTVDVSGKGLVVSVMPLGTTKPIWTSQVCSGASDLRVLGPGDAQTYPVVWKRWESQGTTCPVSKLPTVPQGTYTVNAETGGVTTSAVEFILN